MAERISEEVALVHVKGVRGPAGEYGAHGVVEIRQNANRVYDFMKRIEDQPQWNTGVKLSQIIKRVANTTHVKQVLNWSFLALRGDFSMNLAMHEEPGQMRIRTEMLHGSMMRHFSSNVGVQQLGPNSCRLEMQMFMQPSIGVPLGFRHIVGGQVRRQLRGVLERIKDTLDQEAAIAEQRQQQQHFGLFGSFAQQLQLSSLSSLSSLNNLGSKCDVSAISNVLKSHPLDISVWG